MSDSLQKYDNNTPNGLTKFEFMPNDEGFNSHQQDEGNGLDPQKVIGILFRYKWLVLFFLILGGTGAWFYADTIIPTYESKGSLLISSGDAPNDDLSDIISQTTGYGTGSTLENELQILQSRTFSSQIARKLIEEAPEDISISELPILWTQPEDGEGFRSSEETVAARIRSNISFMRPAEESDVVEVSVKSPSPEEASRIVNLAMQIYVENSTRQNRHAATATADFLEKEKQEIKQKLDSAEDRLRRYMDSSGIVQVNEQASGMVTERAGTEVELQRISLDLQTIEQSISNLESQLERIKPGLSEQFSEAIGPRIRNSQEELARYENERTLIISKNPGVLERNPTPPRLKYLDDQIERLKVEIKELSNQLFTEDDEFMGMDSEDRARMVSDIQTRLVELRIQQNQNKSRYDALMQHKEEMDENFNSLPEGMIELAKLQRDVQINEELYLNVSRQYADMSVWKQSQFGYGRIVDPGVTPSSPVSPNKKIFLLLGLMLGGFLSAGFIVIREFNDNSINDIGQLKRRYLPSLTVVPEFDKISKRHRKLFSTVTGKIPQELVLLQDRSSFASEAIRRLKNTIIYQHGEQPPKTIAVTSPEKGDGKSTIVANLGIAFAEEGYKTLIIDADFRRPKIHQNFGLGDKAGLSDYLDGKISVNELIQSTDLASLKVITAGNERETPEIISNSMTFKQLLKKMEDIFDVIILDTPPFGIISDSTAILKYAEATLVVAKYRKTNRGMLMRTIEELEQIQANITGVVLNSFDHRKETSTYYGSGYYQSLYSNYEAYL